MWTTVLSLGIALVVGYAIVVLVKVTTERRDERRADRGLELPREAGAIVTVRLRRWQWMTIAVVSILFAVVGALATVVTVTALASGASGSDAGPGPAITAGAILLCGVGGLLLSGSMRRTRILGMDDHVLVRQGFRAERRVAVSEIAAVLPLANQYGGLEGRAADGSRLFSVMGLARGFTAFEEYLDERIERPDHPEPTAPWVPPAAG